MKIVDNFPNYFVTNDGHVFNKKGKELKPLITRFGYARVSLSNDTIKHKYIPIHRLVATAFIPNPENLPIINHIDGNKLNNNVNNLEWCTYSHNNLHRIRVLGYTNGGRKAKEIVINGKHYDSINAAQREHSEYTRWYLQKHIDDFQ